MGSGGGFDALAYSLPALAPIQWAHRLNGGIWFFGRGVISRKDCKELTEVLPYIKVPLVANAHPLQINPGVGFLGILKGFGFVSGFAFPNKPFMSSWSGPSRAP